MKEITCSKMKILVIFSFLLSIIQFSCLASNNKESEQINKSQTNKLETSCPFISSETAINIAKGILCLDYDLNDREVKVETEIELWKDKGEMWKVTFYRTKNKDSFGGDPIVWILKSNGERFTVKHEK